MIAREPCQARYCVLVVDDEPQVRELIEAALRSEAINTVPAGDVPQARAALERGGIDLMLLDLMLPGVDGFTFLEQLRSEPQLRPPAIVAISARTSREDILRALELGANDYLTKPFDLDDLLVRVEMWLNRGREEAKEEERRQQLAVLSLYTFGLFRAQKGEKTLIDETFGYRKAKTLFKYLLTHYGQRVPKERLVDLLWPELDEEAGTNNLHGAVHVLRRALESEPKDQYIAYVGGLLYFNTESPHWWDVLAFREHLARAEAAERGGDSEAALAAYAAAVSHYLGPYLEEDLYEDWAAPMRETLREQWLTALTRMATLRAERGEYDEAITLLRKVQREDPYREQTYRDLMVYLNRAGRRPEAVQLYRSAERLFETELGIKPMETTRQLYERLMRGEPI